MNPRTLVVCGKGGVGKTTVSAIIARHFAKMPEHRALLVDADHAGGLCVALDLEPACTLQTLRQQALEELTSQAASRKEDFARAIDFRLLAALTERDHLAFLALGRPDEKGCFCSVNSVLKQGIETLSAQFDTTLIDAEAGVEQINRDVAGNIDFLLLVADPSVKALRVAETIQQVATHLGRATECGLLLNRVHDPSRVTTIQDRTSLPVIGWLPEDPTVQQFDAEARSFFELPDCPASQSVEQALQSFLSTCNRPDSLPVPTRF